MSSFLQCMFLVTTLWLVFSTFLVWWRYHFDDSFLLRFHQQQVTSSRHAHRPQTHNDEYLTIHPGELPGYTGWARPEHTMASHFAITARTDDKAAAAAAIVGREWTVTVECFHVACRTGGAHFYVRLYGPAVLSGQVEDHQDGSYTISALPLDPGTYAVEVVLAFSQAPKWDDFPLAGNESEPAYEGYMLPGFPLQLTVHDNHEKATKDYNADMRRPCSVEDLVTHDPNDGPSHARWVVTNKIVHPHHEYVSFRFAKTVSLQGYKDGQNALGIWMKYARRTCSLLPWPPTFQDTRYCLRQDEDEEHPPRVIFIGDSVMQMQQRVFQELVGSTVPVNMVTTGGGIVRRLSNVTSRLDSLHESCPNQRRFVLFNTGLHDIAQLCSHRWLRTRRNYINSTEDKFSCTREYRQYLTKLVEFVSNFPADLRVFQTTTAGWPKHGNFGFAWPPATQQPFPLSPNFVAHMNEIAYQVIRKFENVLMVDGYWITHARPDNREVNEVNVIGKHMVHPGNEVLQAMVHTWWMMLLRKTSSRCLGDGNEMVLE